MADNNNGFVTFNKESFNIEVKTYGNPVEEWQEIYRSLLYYVGMENEDSQVPHSVRYHLTVLLEAMLPKWEDAKKMAK